MSNVPDQRPPERATPTSTPASAGPGLAPLPSLDDIGRFAIGFDERDRSRLHELWDAVFASNQWSEGAMTAQFEAAWSAWNGAPSVAFSSWAGGALAALRFRGVGPGDTVLVPSNTFMATALAVVETGASVQFYDCNREDLCGSFADFQRAAEEHKPTAAWLVHIGGHIAFDSAEIAAYCRDQDIFLIEDCAHAHGADWNGQRPGTWGDCGVYSFYATKTVSTGEGGVLVTQNPELERFARLFRNYGKPEHEVAGLNFRMSEFTAAIGLVQAERLEEIVAWKNTAAREVLDPLHAGRLQLPDGMTSGLYKYIVFDPIDRSTGKVYDQPCHRIMGHDIDLPNSDWVATHHWCVPLYYRPATEPESSESNER